ncbi:MAG: hypothetical protein LBK60_11330 [Verrucomicrobiales bacterium]|jgi:hypothetical protein|nr:hypothetical protein [Verrucomicrobiales bacterium]
MTVHLFLKNLPVLVPLAVGLLVCQDSALAAVALLPETSGGANIASFWLLVQDYAIQIICFFGVISGIMLLMGKSQYIVYVIIAAAATFIIPYIIAEISSRYH